MHYSWSGSFFLLVKFLKRFLPSASQRSAPSHSRNCCAISGLGINSWICLFTKRFCLFFLVSAITLLIWNPEKPAWVILHSTAVGYLYWIHPTAIGVIAASIFTVTLMCWKNRRWSSLFFHVFSVSLLVLSYKIVLQPWMMRKMTPNGYLSKNPLPGFFLCSRSYSHFKVLD